MNEKQAFTLVRLRPICPDLLFWASHQVNLAIIKQGLIVKKEYNRALSFFSVLVLATGCLSAQTDVSFTSYLIRDGNTFKSRLARDEWITNPNLRVTHRLGNENYRLQGFYTGDFLLYATNNELNNHTHTFGVTGSYYDDLSTLSITASARLLNFRESFAYYSANRYSLSGSYEYVPTLEELYMLGVAVTNDDYREFDELDNASYRIYGRVQRFFQSKLSITGELGLGVKDYTNQSVINYYGSGIGWGNAARFNEVPVSAALFSASVNVGKSITSHTGISAGIGGQWFIGDPIVAYSSGIYYYTENDLYDDPYSYQGPYATLQLTEQISVGFQAKLGLKIHKKRYSGTPALNDVGQLTGAQREDTRSEYSFMISKKFRATWPISLGIDVFFGYVYRSNPSNDPYYEFKDHIGLIGFTVGI